MKKFAKVMAVALVAVLALAALVACGPASDPEKAAKALKDNGYTVMSVIPDDSVTGKLAQATLDGIAVAAGLEAGDITATVSATKGSESISITYFKSASAAKKFWDENKDNVQEKEGWVTKQSGSMIYTGTEQAVKDAR